MSMSDNQAAVVDEGAFTVRRTIRIAAPIEKVWSAVTDPAHISQWFGRVSLEGSGAGAAGTISWEGRDPIPLRVEAIDAPRMVSYRWGNDDASGVTTAQVDPEHSTVFTFTLEDVGDGTRLTVVETGFDTTSDPIANLASHREGWESELDKLVALLEAGA
jgi:uncharacterized protein YndB with AHSA1/START domain